MATRKPLPTFTMAASPAWKETINSALADYEAAGLIQKAPESKLGFQYKLRQGTAPAPVERPLAPEFVASPQQAAFFNEVEDGAGNVILEAVAGAGKTTTLIQAMKRMNGRIFFGAYNQKIVAEIEEKARDASALRDGVFISTMHSIGYKVFRNGLSEQERRFLKVTDTKSRDILDEMIKEAPLDMQLLMKQAQGFVCKLVSFAKQYLIGVKASDGSIYGGDEGLLPPWLTLVDHFALNAELNEKIPVSQAVAWTLEVYRRSRARCRKVIDFDDMIYAPLALGCKFYNYDWLLGDEWQDANPARREMAMRMLAPGGRALFVGDDRQAIYGFAGASSGSLAITQKMFNCKLMPLTVTYRCAKSIVTHAHQWVNHIQAHPSAKDGVVRAFTPVPPLKDQKPLPWYAVEAIQPSDAVLCRYTRPLIMTAYEFLRAGIACKVEGRDIGNGLCKLAQRWSIRTISALETRLGEYLDNELRKAALKEDTKREQEVTDVVDTLRIFIERSRAKGHTQIDQLVGEIQSLFADNVTNVTVLSTGHKAKGREWDRVFWIQANGGRPSEREWQKIEEDNIKYVICTRARNELVLVPEPPKPEKAK